MLYFALKYLTVDAAIVAAVARIVVLADFLFTATAVVAQPLTGIALAYEAGYSLRESWIVLSIVLYIVTGAFWLPKEKKQKQKHNHASAAAADGKPLPARYQ